jgi:hypothetical protein
MQLNQNRFFLEAVFYYLYSMKRYHIPKIPKFTTWLEVESLSDFSNPWRAETPPRTEFRAFHDGIHLHFQFMAFGNRPLVYIENNNKLEVRYSERVELFFRTDEAMTPYYCLEMDPNGRTLDYEAKLYRDFNRDWSWPEPLNLKIEIRDDFYSLQGMMTIATLTRLGIVKNRHLEVGVYRGHCIDLLKNDNSIQWVSWVDPKTATPDFHVPESFGMFQLGD